MENYKNTPLWDNSLTVEERLDYLVKALTLEEKIACLTTGCPDVERLGIKSSYMGGEAAHGIEARHDQAFNRGEPEPTTSFTQPIGMSASFDRELIRECGRCVGEEQGRCIQETVAAACADGRLPLIWNGIPDGEGQKRPMGRIPICQGKCPQLISGE